MDGKKYIRDKRSPTPKSENVSKVMSANKAKNSIPELLVRKLLRERGMTGYRLHPKDVIGKPDLVFKKKKIAVFIHGCFWHGCDHCQLSTPKHNSAFWIEKITKNKERDNKKENELKANGWNVITLWECQLKQDQINEIEKIIKTYESNSH